MRRDNSYYGRESSVYSSKRYPETDTDYVHFFFKKRREILMRMLGDFSAKLASPSLLEIGCADGIILQGIKERLPRFDRLVGIDVSPEMIEEAKRKHPSLEFHVRGAESYGAFDVVVEVGVLNLTNLDSEFRYVKSCLNPDGIYICSIASSSSLRNKFVPINGGFLNHMPFKDYEREMKKHFKIVVSRAYGLHVPLIWRYTLLARWLQPKLESVLRPLFPGLFHEKIYVLSPLN